MILFEWLQSSPAALAGFVFILGLLVGSFLNVVIYRLPKMMERAWQAEARAILEQPEQPEGTPFNLVVPRSACPHCGHQIRWYENIPLVSWLVLRGKCSQCGKGISARYPLVELAAGLLGLMAALHFGYGAWLVAVMLACWVLLALAMIDFDTTLLPDSLTYPLLWGGLLAAWASVSPVSLHDAVIGAAAGYLALWSVYWAFKLLTGKEGMGYGDFKLFAALGAWFGWTALIPMILMASVIGAVVGIAMKVFSQLREGGYVPFGPFLALAGLTALFFGPSSILAVLGL